MPSRIQQNFIQVTFAAIIALGISLPALADDFPWPPANDVSSLEETNHRSSNTRPGAVWHLFHESDHKGSRVSGLNFFFTGSTDFLGLSAQQIRSPKITFQGHQDNLESVYLFYGLQMDLPVSPFAEAGIDLAEWLLEELLTDSEDDEANNTESSEDESSFVDAYFAIGIQARLRQSFFMRAYYKMYIINQENRSTYVPVTGIQVGIRF